MAVSHLNLGFLPPIIPEENFWDKWHRVFHGPNVLPVTQPMTSKQ